MFITHHTKTGGRGLASSCHPSEYIEKDIGARVIILVLAGVRSLVTSANFSF